jgi:hypothetical protein
MMPENDDVMRGHIPAGSPKEPGPQPTVSQGRYVPAPFVWEQLSPEQRVLLGQRQRSRSIVMASLLGLFVILVFAIAIAKIRAGHA